MRDLVTKLIGITAAALAAAAGAVPRHTTDMLRIDRFGSLAKRLDLTLERGYHAIFSESYYALPMFRRGWQGAAFNTMRGVLHIHGRPFPIHMSDYRYVVGEGRDERDEFFSYLVVQLPFAGVPDTLIRPEGVADKLATELGHPDINFESAEFSRRFHVQSASKRFAYDLLSGPAMEFLLNSKPCRIEITHGHLLMGNGARWSVSRFIDHYLIAEGFLKCWPPHLAELLDSGRWLDEERS
jgi:hypothetical protein